VRNRAIYVVIGVNMQGNKEVLGLWAGQTEGAKFWNAGIDGAEEPGRSPQSPTLRSGPFSLPGMQG